jgi:hypothetical protein
MHGRTTTKTRVFRGRREIVVLSLPESIETNYECGGEFRSSSLAIGQSMASGRSVFKSGLHLASALFT